MLRACADLNLFSQTHINLLQGQSEININPTGLKSNHLNLIWF